VILLLLAPPVKQVTRMRKVMVMTMTMMQD
jgi:hypothetical protein